MDKKRTIMVLYVLMAATVPSSVLTDEWKASVVKSLRALVTSCVVVPCSFTYPEKLPTSRLRAIWHRKDNWKQIIYQKEDTGVLDNFKGRTHLLGKLGEGNCTLEIVEIKDHDNGDFCFRIELTPSEKGTSEKFSFVEDCFSLEMLHGPPKPTVYHQETAVQDQPFSVFCRVPHTCPSHRPTLTWSRGTADQVTSFNRELHTGTWEEESILTITPGVKDDQTEITCTAQFFGHARKSSSTTLMLYVKRRENYNHIIIPASVGIGIAVVFGVLCIVTVKKYKKRISELQSQDGSVWNRLSRISRRVQSRIQRPPRSDQRRPTGDLVMSPMPNNVNSKSCADQQFSKPRFPSPKSQPKSYTNKEDPDDADDYVNTADLNVYGNL